MTTLKLENKEFTGTFIPFPNNCGYYFQLENGNLLEGLYKQGYYGKKLFLLPITFNYKKQFEYTVNNSGRQVKDPNAYFIRFEN